jgi:hypothetical protein
MAAPLLPEVKFSRPAAECHRPGRASMRLRALPRAATPERCLGAI